MTTEDKKTTGSALAKAAANLPAIDAKAAAAALRGSADDASTGSGDFEFLSFSGKRGTYSLGREKVTPDIDAIYVIEPMAAVEGWTCWKGGKPAGKHEWSTFERATKQIRAEELADHGPYNEKAGEGWQYLLGIGMFDIDNADKQIKYSTTSVSGRNVVSDLNTAIADELIEGQDGIAIVQLDMEEFEAHGQKNFKPKIDILGFVSRDEVTVFLEIDGYDVDDLLEGRCIRKGEPDVAPEEEPEAEPEQAPATTRRSRSRPAPAEEPAKEPAPTGRRRRAV